MNKSQFYLSQCVEAASKSLMYYTLGSVIVKGGKVISTGFNHQRPNYEGDALGNGTPLSMHAEMDAIYKTTRGRAPALKQQVQPRQLRTGTPKTTRKWDNTKEETELQEEQAAGGGQGQGFRAATDPETCFLRGEGEAYVLPVALLSPRSSPGGSRAAAGRSRSSKLNGCDLYVCRITKTGNFGCSKPCWRCVDWCAWAGIKRIFHWSVEEGRFLCIKVGDASEDVYQTTTDTRLLAARGLKRGRTPKSRTLSLR
ncbi:hypothetical protein B0H10DRAFT_2173969 [Mycena sp. CBHHK59/15]|nr:hypothetical protein B0H10DRAFT_2173969 [Mycena sp. CBHHK59/15]